MRRRRDRLPDAGVAVVPGDLLDHIDLGLAVGPPGRNVDGLDTAGDFRTDAEPDRVQQRGDRVVREVGSEDGVDARGAHVDLTVFVGQALSGHVDDAVV